MNLTDIQLHTLLPDGTAQIRRLINTAGPLEGANLINAPLIVKAQPGTQYKLLNIESGAHQKGQRLMRQNKDLKVFLDDAPAIELQDYFVASVSPVANAAVYRLENQSCDEVQVISHYPPETFNAPESLVWTESDSALDCKVALYNPGTLLAFVPIAPVSLPASIGLKEVAAAILVIPALSGGSGGTGTPVTPPPHPLHPLHPRRQ